jgi:predicted HicB family RNase H-like nuclease
MKDVLVHKGFIGSVHFSTDDRLFFGKLEGIDDLVTFEGTTVDELENAFKYMVEQHIADCEAEGKPMEKSYKGTLNVRLNPDLHKQAAKTAITRGITLNQFIQNTIRKELEAEK